MNQQVVASRACGMKLTLSAAETSRVHVVNRVTEALRRERRRSGRPKRVRAATSMKDFGYRRSVLLILVQGYRIDPSVDFADYMICRGPCASAGRNALRLGRRGCVLDPHAASFHRVVEMIYH